MSRRVLHQPGFVLHRRPWSESSLVVELFTQEYGRVGVLAKGARRLKSPYRGLLEPFQELQISWSGKGELPVLTGVEFRARQSRLDGSLIFSGFYLNELMLRLLVRRDPPGGLFDSYAEVLTGLRVPEQRTDSLLRQFELELLGYLGYGMELEFDSQTQQGIEADRWYHYVAELGPIAHDSASFEGSLSDQGGGQGVIVRGKTLMSMREADFSDRVVLRESKQLLRELLRQLLDGKPLHSRNLLQGVHQRLSGTAKLPQQRQG